MPVNLLYCEGGPKSPDIRTVFAVLAGVCVVEPVGGKYGFGQRIRLAREIKIGTVAGLRDRDFDDEDLTIHDKPREWRVEAGRVWLGWYWERNTIENYLIDPAIVARALGSKAPPVAGYQAALRSSAESIADYTAARFALSRSRLHFSPLDNAWGPERGSDHHPFPADRNEAECRRAIGDIVRQHQVEQTANEAEVMSKFDEFLPTCRPPGVRFRNFLTYFSGKDLLFGMETALIGFGFASPFEFRERVLKGLEYSPEDVWTWLPEWSRLRELVRSFS